MYKSFISNLQLILPCVATSLGLTLLPICPAIVQQTITWPIQIRKLPCRFWLYLRVEYRLFPLRQLVGLFRCRFGLARPVLALQSDLPPHAPSILSLLTGIASARPSALVEGAGVEPAVLIRGFRGIIAAVVGCRSISSVDGPNIPLSNVAGLLLVSGFFLPFVSWYFLLG